MSYLSSATSAGLVALLLMLSFNTSAVIGETSSQGRRVAQGRRVKKQTGPTRPRIDYSHFSHRTHLDKENLSCDGCHKFPTANWQDVRQGDDAFPDVAEFPEHETCLTCHRRQFFARERPAPAICSNCHVKVTPRNTARFPFPSLGESFFATVQARNFVSDFVVLFPHDKHADADCADCHQTHQPQGQSDDEFLSVPPKNIGDAFWLKKGTFQTRPFTHAGCFSCHNQESELAPLPPNCNACHKPPAAEKRAADFDEQLAGTMGIQDWWTMTAWRVRISAGAFRHEVHAEVKCAQCHQAVPMNAVSVKSCGGAEGCHLTATADDGGILNYEIDQKKTSASFVCTKCHISFGKEASPESHLRAIEALKKP